jgi:hypothetical protein
MHARGVFPWFSTNTGIYFFDDPWHLSQANIQYALLVFAYDTLHRTQTTFIPNIVPSSSHVVLGCYASIDRSPGSLPPELEKARNLNAGIYFALGWEGRYGPLADFPVMGRRALVSHHVLERIETLKEYPEYLAVELLEDDFLGSVTREWENKDWVLWQIGDCPQPELDFAKFAEENSGENYDEWPCILAEWYFKDDKPEFKLSPLARVWRDVLGSPVIPFDLEERRRKLAHAYEELEAYIEAHEILKRQKAKAS